MPKSYALPVQLALLQELQLQSVQLLAFKENIALLVQLLLLTVLPELGVIIWICLMQVNAQIVLLAILALLEAHQQIGSSVQLTNTVLKDLQHQPLVQLILTRQLKQVSEALMNV